MNENVSSSQSDSVDGPESVGAHPLGLGLKRMLYDLTIIWSVIGLVWWIQHGDRPDLAFAVGSLILRWVLWDMWLMPDRNSAEKGRRK